MASVDDGRPELPDPATAASTGEFAARLREMMLLTGRTPPGVVSASRGTVSRSTVYNIINGRPVTEGSLTGFLDGCGIARDRHGPWQAKRHELYPDRERTPLGIPGGNAQGGGRVTAMPKDLRLRSIQVVLQQDRSASPEFGRPAGPIWSDLELGYHPFSAAQYSAVKYALESYRFHLVSVPEIHWRRQFALYLGWRLAADGRAVYHTDTERWDNSADLSAAIAELDTAGTVVIIENVHHNATLCEDVLSRIGAGTKSVKCMFVAEPSLEAVLLRRPYFTSELADLPSSTVNSYELASTLMARYATKKMGRELGPRNMAHFLLESQSRGRFTLFYDDDRPPEERSYNLWLLLAQLRSWDGRVIPSSRTLDRVAADFAAAQVVQPLLHMGTGIASLAAAVAFLQFYGVAPSVHFLRRNLGFTATETAAAEGAGILRFSSRRAELTDQWIPRALCEAARATPEIVSDLETRLRIGPDHPGSSIIDLLLWTGLSVPPDRVQRSTLVAYLTAGEPGYDLLLLNWTATFDRPSPAARAIHPATLQALIPLLRAERSAVALGRALVGLARVDADVAGRLAETLDTSHLLDLISASPSVKDIAWLLEGLRTASPAKAQQLARLAGGHVLNQKLHATTQLTHIASLVWALRRADEATAADLLGVVDQRRLAHLIADTNDIGAVGWLLLATGNMSVDTATGLLAQITPRDLAHRVIGTSRCRDAACLLWGLAQAAPGFASEVVSIVGYRHFREFVSVEPNLRFTALLLRALAIADRRVASRAVARLSIESQQLRLLDAPPDAAAMYLQAVVTVSPRLRRQMDDVVQEINMEWYAATSAYHMFSSMNPQAMARAGKRADRAKKRLEAIDAYAAILASDRDGPRPLDNPDALTTWLWTLWEYEPERCVTIIAHEWHQIAAALTDLATIEAQTQLSIMLRSINPAGFAGVIRGLHCVLSPSCIADLNKAITIAETTPFGNQTLQILLNHYMCDDVDSIAQTAGEPEVANLLPRLVSTAPHIVSGLVRSLSWETVAERTYGREGLFGLALRLRPDFVDQAVRLISGQSNGDGDQGTACDRVERTSGILGLYGHGYTGRLEPEDVALLNSLLGRAAVLDAIAQCDNLQVLTNLLTRLRSLDSSAASNMAAALDPKVIASRVTAETSGHTIGQFLGVIAQLGSILVDRLVNVIAGSLAQRPPKFAATLLASVQRNPAVSGMFAARLEIAMLIELMEREDSLPGVSALLEAVAGVTPGLARNLLHRIADTPWIPSMFHAANLYQINALLHIATKIDTVAAANLTARIETTDLTRLIQSSSRSATKEVVATLVRLNPQLVHDLSEAVLLATVPRQAEHNMVNLTDVCEILDSLQVSHPTLVMYVASIDIEELARLFRDTSHRHRRLWGLERFVGLICYTDVETALTLHRLAPDVVTPDIMREAMLDATGHPI